MEASEVAKIFWKALTHLPLPVRGLREDSKQFTNLKAGFNFNSRHGYDLSRVSRKYYYVVF